MKKGKLLNNIYLIICCLLLTITFFSYDKNNTNQVVPKPLLNSSSVPEYYDYSELNSLSIDYSYSTLLVNKDTEFIIYDEKTSGKVTKTKSENLGGKELPTITLHNNDEALLIITNCAVNKFGEKLDVVIKINNVKVYEGTKGFIKLRIQDTVNMLHSQDQANPKDSYLKNLNIGDPVEFFLGAEYAYCDFVMTYYKSGTYNPKTDKGVYGDINYINSFFNDFDANANRCALYEFLCGSEGIVPRNGQSKIYYKKNSPETVQPGYTRNVGPKGNGIAVTGENTGENTDAWYYAQTVLILTENLKNSTYTFTYGGLSCRIDYFFAPPYPYDSVPNPIRNVSKEKVIPGEELIYKTSQYVPNSYYSMAFGFEAIYSNFKENSEFYDKSSFTYLSLIDNVNPNYEILKDKITVTNETGIDVSKDFEIKITGNNVTAIAKDYNFESSTFYSHTYTLNIPVKLKDDTKKLDKITDLSQSVYQIGNRPKINSNTNKITVYIEYIIEVNYLDKKTEEKIIESDILRKAYNDKYSTDFAKIDKAWTLVEIPNNATGVVTENTTVNYYFNYNPEKNKYTVIINYLEDIENKKIADTDILEIVEGEEYKTDCDKIDKEKWELIKIPDNANGIAKENITVNYYFKKIDNKEIINPPTGNSNIILFGFLIIIIAVVIRYLNKKYKIFYKI